MKKILFVAMAFISIGAMAQNIQMHYDFGKERKCVTTTLERFTPDTLGSTYYFVDMDYTFDGVQQAYWEIAREFKYGNMPIALHLEYNGGIFTDDYLHEYECFEGYKMSNSYLAGLTYSLDNADYTKGISFSAMYKYIQENELSPSNNDEDGRFWFDNDFNPHNFQITTVWYMHFFDKKLSFTGFADFWMEETWVWDEENHETDYDGEYTDFIFITEPQLWYNFFDGKLSVGGELEMSVNFATNKGFMINPTLGVKYVIH